MNRIELAQEANCRLCMDDVEVAEYVLCTCSEVIRTRYTVLEKLTLQRKTFLKMSHKRPLVAVEDLNNRPTQLRS